jgi:hypothetical protein
VKGHVGIPALRSLLRTQAEAKEFDGNTAVA